MGIPVSFRTSVNAIEVNCEPWSVLNISDYPCRASASSIASMQKSPLSSTATVSAPSKKSFSRVSSTILTCSIFTSIGASSDDDFLFRPKISFAPARNWSHHCLIWLGWTSYCWVSSLSVYSPRTAASATFDLKPGVWLRRGRRVMIVPLLMAK